MKNFLLVLALAAGFSLAARAQTTEPATDASGVPLISKSLLAPGTAAPPVAPARRAPLPPNQQAARQSQRLIRALGLSAPQQGQVRRILLGEYQNLAAARQQAQAAGTRRGLGRAVQGNRAQADQQLRQVLSPDQYARYQQLLAQRRQQARQRRQPGSASLLGD